MFHPRRAVCPTAILGVAMTVAACSPSNDGAAPTDWAAADAAWHAERIERLTAPDGWLSLVGLHWIEPGVHRIGSADDCDIRLNTGPDHLGTLVREGDALRFAPAEGVAAATGEAPIEGELALITDAGGQTPTRVGFDVGQASFEAIVRGDRVALRVRDARAETRTGFAGIERFAPDPSWRFEARFEPHPEGRTIPIANVLGQLEPMPNQGTLVFERDGREFRLETVDEGDGRLFVIFADRSNGAGTYGAGRSVYAEPPDAEGRSVLDFNRGYNPPCAFTAYSTCPLPPPENRMDIRVEAGELTYH